MTQEETSHLYRELSAKHNWPDSKYLPIILKRLATPEQVKILLQFPATAEQIANKLGLDRETVEKELQLLFEKGLAFYSKKGWRLNRIIDSLHDLTIIATKFFDANGGKETLDLWIAFEELEWFPRFVKSIDKLGSPLMRLMPAWEAIKDIQGHIPSEDMREIYKAANLIVDVPCCCRVERYDKTCGTPDGMCIALDRSGEYNLKRGVGRKLSLEEALELEQEARRHNMITQVPNNAVGGQIICHCHPCCCVDFRAFKQAGRPVTDFMAKTRYLATINPETCIGCQRCVEACQFEAIAMVHVPGMTRWKAWVNPDRCAGCGNCVVSCPKEGTAVLHLVKPPEHIPGEDFNVYIDRY